MSKEILYTDDKNAQVVLAMLKQYNIRKVVISPGMTNVPISRSVQQDPFFEVYSVVDERSAAYFAVGLAFSSSEPVVISCTGATASRNYLPGLTEAYYRNLPVIAVTSQHHSPDYSDLVPQLTDRTVSQNDIKRYAALLPVIKDSEDEKKCIFQVNKALHMSTQKGRGPVHINLPVTSFNFSTKKLPDITKIEYFDAETLDAKQLVKEISGKKVGLFIGSHNPFSAEVIGSINNFVKKTGAAVFYDHTSNYTGNNRVLISQASDLLKTKKLPDIMIDLGSISGDYSAPLLTKNVKTWRISEDYDYHNRKGEQSLQKVFGCTESLFFKALAEVVPQSRGATYFDDLQKDLSAVVTPELPLSNTYVSYMLSSRLPKNSTLHMGILNSLRNMNFFEVDRSIELSCNVGGFGIDGPISTLLGQSMFSKNRIAFGLVGDLAFFYDMNALGIRHLDKNLRVILVNNGTGVEFRLNDRLESQWGDDTSEFIAASGHNGSAQAWAEARGFKYITADSKEDFDELIGDFCNKDVNHFGRPVLFEVFTKVDDEQDAIRLMRQANSPKGAGSGQSSSGSKATAKKAIKKVVPKKGVAAYKKLRSKI